MPSAGRCLLPLLLLLPLLATPTARAQGRLAELDVEIESVVRRSQVGVCRIGIALLDPEDGTILAEFDNSRGDDAAFIPASNMKLFTSGAALLTLRPDFAFETTLLRMPGQSGLGDRLVVRGSGDPAFADPELLEEMDLSVEDLLAMWVDAIEGTGVTSFDELVIDDRIFDRQLVHPTWPREQLNRWYCAEVAGLNFHANVVRVLAAPTQRGAPPRVLHVPEDAPIDWYNRARSIKRGKHTFWASRRNGTNRITLQGDVLFSGRPLEVTVHDPALVFAEILADRVRDRGIEIDAIRRAGDGDALRGGDPLHIVRTPLPTILRRCNVDSHNLYAEAQLKRLGHEITGEPGSWRQGTAALRMVVQPRVADASVPPSALRFADGSGMSRDNRVTPRAVAAWLGVLARDETLAEPFIDSLAVPGAGTLRNRFRDTGLRANLHAKSGYLTGVSALSGYLVDPESGRRVVFAVLINDRPGSVPGDWVQAFYEDVLTVADGWLADLIAEEAERLGG